MRRRALAGMAAAAVVAIGAWGFVQRPVEDWVPVGRRDLVIATEVEGELRAVDSAALGPPQIASIWDFKISSMAPEGVEIEKGQPALVFDTTRLQQQLQEKIAERDSAEKELEKKTTGLEIERRDRLLVLAEAEADLRRADLQLSVPGDLVARRELGQARIDRHLAQLRIAQAQRSLEHLATRGRADLSTLASQGDRAAARVRQIESDILAMRVLAPRSGTVIYKTDWRGDKKKVGDTVWRARKVLEIPDLGRMLGEGEVAEAEAGRVEEGQHVRLRLDAYPDREYPATVRKIRRTVQRKSRADPRKVVRLTLELDATDTERMRPGMRFRGEIETERIAGGLVIPSAAIFPRPAGAAVYVRTLFGRREVFPTFGRRNRELVGVVSGLAEGDRILRRTGMEGPP